LSAANNAGPWIEECKAHGLVGLRLGGHLFGLPIRTVREIFTLQDITPVERSPDYVRGLVNLRGQIVTVLDLSMRMSMGTQDSQEKNPRLVVLKTNGELDPWFWQQGLATCDERIAFWVHSVADVVKPPEEAFAEPMAHASADTADHVFAAVSLGGETMACLSPAGLAGTMSQSDGDKFASNDFQESRA